MDNRSVTVIVIVLIITLIYYSTDFQFDVELHYNSLNYNDECNENGAFSHLVHKLGEPSYVDPELGCVWQSNELLQKDNYFQKIGLIKDSVVIWTPINIFAHVDRSKVQLSNKAYAVKLRKLLTALEPGMVSFDPVRQIMMVKAPYLGQALAVIYLMMKMTAGEMKYDPSSNRDMMEKITLATVPGHNQYDHLMESRMDTYIRDYILSYC